MAPDGTLTLLSRGVQGIRGTSPGEPRTVTVRSDQMSSLIPEGHRVLIWVTGGDTSFYKAYPGSAGGSLAAGEASTVTLPLRSGGPGGGQACAIELRGTRKRDRLRATDGGEKINARAGNDRVSARGGDDCVKGKSGADRLRGQGGDDRLLGGSGRAPDQGSRGRPRRGALRQGSRPGRRRSPRPRARLREGAAAEVAPADGYSPPGPASSREEPQMAVIESPEKIGPEALPRVRRGQRDVAARRPPGGDPRGRGRVPRPLRDRGQPRQRACARSTSRRRAIRSSSPSAAPPTGANPYINIINRLQVVQFEDFEGRLRTLAYEPTVPEGPAEAPVSTSSRSSSSASSSPTRCWRRSGTTPTRRSPRPGLRVEDVDFVSFDHLHVQDVRFVLGTTEPIEGETGAAPAAVPEREADHPAQGVGHVRLASPDAVGLVRRATGSRTCRRTTSC